MIEMEVNMTWRSTLLATPLAATFAAATLGLGSTAQAQPYGGGWGYMGPGMMGGWGGWGGGGIFPFSGIFGLLVLALIIVAAVWFARAILRSREPALRTEHYAAGLDVLDQRYARGEINRDEYLQKRGDVLG